MDVEHLKQNLTTQLDEIESLQSVYYNPGEIRVEDPVALQEIQEFVSGKTAIVPPYLDLVINLLVDNHKFELCVNVSHEYPDAEPDLYVRNHKQSRAEHAKLNKDVSEYVSSLERGEPCLFSAISWLQDNASGYVRSEEVIDVQKETKDEQLVRYWIYSHHIYSKTKRREILNLAGQLHLTGFSMPGKPGIICVEGASSDCNEWWQTIKSMNWKRIFCKVTEECKGDASEFLKFQMFSEVIFQNNSIKCAHMDLGELHKFLEKHNCDYVFKDLFGVDSKTNNA